MDRRDKLRTIGSFFRSILSLIPMMLFLWATWYTVQNGDALLKKITTMAAEQAGKVAQQNAGNIYEQMNSLLKKK